MNLRRTTTAAVFLVAVPSACLAMMDLETVSKERAKELGLEIRATAAGPDAVRIVLEFAKKGQLLSYHRVALEVRDGGKLLVSSTMKDETPQGKDASRVVVGFAADRTALDKLTLRVVTNHSPRSWTGYDIRVKEFVNLANGK